MRGWLEKLAWKSERFMQGRNGQDDLARVIYWAGFILLILSFFDGTGICSLLAFALLFYAMFRMLSKNIDKRQKENNWYLVKTEKLRKNASQQKLRFDERKEYRFFKCKCGATLRVRRGQGTKELVCPICHEHMTRKT